MRRRPSSHLKHAAAHLQDGDIKGAATQVIHGEHALLLVRAVAQRSGRGLVDDALHIQPRNAPRVLGGLALAVIEVGCDPPRTPSVTAEQVPGWETACVCWLATRELAPGTRQCLPTGAPGTVITASETLRPRYASARTCCMVRAACIQPACFARCCDIHGMQGCALHVMEPFHMPVVTWLVGLAYQDQNSKAVHVQARAVKEEPANTASPAVSFILVRMNAAIWLGE